MRTFRSATLIICTPTATLLGSQNALAAPQTSTTTCTKLVGDY